MNSGKASSMPDINKFRGKSWSLWFDSFKTVDRSAHRKEDENDGEEFDRRVTRLPREDMGLFGLCPEIDKFVVVVCSQCKAIVKPQGLQRHVQLKHSVTSSFPSYLPPPQSMPKKHKSSSLNKSNKRSEKSSSTETITSGSQASITSGSQASTSTTIRVPKIVEPVSIASPPISSSRSRSKSSKDRKSHKKEKVHGKHSSDHSSKHSEHSSKHSDHASKHSVTVHSSKHSTVEHSSKHSGSDHSSKHAVNDHISKHAFNDHVSKHSVSDHISKHAVSDHVSKHAVSDHGSKHSSNDHGSKHAVSDHGSKHAASDHTLKHSTSEYSSKHPSSDHSKHTSSDHKKHTSDHSKHVYSDHSSKHSSDHSSKHSSSDHSKQGLNNHKHSNSDRVSKHSTSAVDHHSSSHSSDHSSDESSSKSVSCKGHLVSIKKDIVGKSKDFDELLAEHRSVKDGSSSSKMKSSKVASSNSSRSSSSCAPSKKPGSLSSSLSIINYSEDASSICATTLVSPKENSVTEEREVKHPPKSQPSDDIFDSSVCIDFPPDLSTEALPSSTSTLQSPLPSYPHEREDSNKVTLEALVISDIAPSASLSLASAAHESAAVSPVFVPVHKVKAVPTQNKFLKFAHMESLDSVPVLSIASPESENSNSASNLPSVTVGSLPYYNSRPKPIVFKDQRTAPLGTVSVVSWYIKHDMNVFCRGVERALQKARLIDQENNNRSVLKNNLNKNRNMAASPPTFSPHRPNILRPPSNKSPREQKILSGMPLKRPTADRLNLESKRIKLIDPDNLKTHIYVTLGEEPNFIDKVLDEVSVITQ